MSQTNKSKKRHRLSLSCLPSPLPIHQRGVQEATLHHALPVVKNTLAERYLPRQVAACLITIKARLDCTKTVVLVKIALLWPLRLNRVNWVKSPDKVPTSKPRATTTATMKPCPSTRTSQRLTQQLCIPWLVEPLRNNQGQPETCSIQDRKMAVLLTQKSQSKDLTRNRFHWDRPKTRSILVTVRRQGYSRQPFRASNKFHRLHNRLRAQSLDRKTNWLSMHIRS